MKMEQRQESVRRLFQRKIVSCLIREFTKENALKQDKVVASQAKIPFSQDLCVAGAL